MILQFLDRFHIRRLHVEVGPCECRLSARRRPIRFKEELAMLSLLRVENTHSRVQLVKLDGAVLSTRRRGGDSGTATSWPLGS